MSSLPTSSFSLGFPCRKCRTAFVSGPPQSFHTRCLESQTVQSTREKVFSLFLARAKLLDMLRIDSTKDARRSRLEKAFPTESSHLSQHQGHQVRKPRWGQRGHGRPSRPVHFDNLMFELLSSLGGKASFAGLRVSILPFQQFLWPRTAEVYRSRLVVY